VVEHLWVFSHVGFFLCVRWREPVAATNGQAGVERVHEVLNDAKTSRVFATA